MTFGKLKRALIRMILGEDIFAPKRIWETGAASWRYFGNAAENKGVQPLACHGCAHSAANAPYPGSPSGERPCMFCVRNPNQARDLARVRHYAPNFVSPRYDNQPVSQIPADQYIATDRLMRDVPAGTITFT